MTDLVFGILTVGLLCVIIAIATITPIRSRARLFLQDSQVSLIAVGVIGFIAMLGSLWYSDVLGYPPCKLCWYQRIFMYPIPLLGFIAYVYKEAIILKYIKIMALVGLGLAAFHTLQQRLPESGLSCGTVGQTVSCGTLDVNVFGIITIPVMAGSIFLAILLVCHLSGKK